MDEQDYFLVFAGSQYYPLGGCEDCRGMFTDEADAMEYIATIKCDWWQVCHVDPLDGLVLINSGRND